MVILNYINTITILSTSEGFGINTDIFETNILNLSVVIGILIYYGRIAFSDIIYTRKQTILKNLQEAENKFKEAEENLNFAKKNFETAKSKADQIRNQGIALSNQTAKGLLEVIEEDIKRIKLLNLLTIKLEEEKSISQVSQKLSLLAFSNAIDKLNKKLNPIYHKKIISQNIDKLSKNFLNIV
uniref:ATP synthase subunit b, chloroplastic n=1 Tax=Euglena clara TaxID=215708 RepID=A0A2Z4YUU0_9EUGL|nr:ATPase subunit I [Euglena clara]AXA45477.1 ATPase subunit I [Euglena clara]